MRFSTACFFMAIGFLSCQPGPSQQDAELKSKLDTLNNRLGRLEQKTQSKETANVIADSIHVIQPAPLAKVPKRIKPEEDPHSVLTPNESDIPHFFKGSIPPRLSYKITPWIDGRRKVTIYRPNGDVSWEINDEQFSWSSTTSIIRMHPNGAIAELEISFNPGASLYHYWERITLDDSNMPISKTKDRTPPYGLDEYPLPEKWDSMAHQWVKP